MQNRSKRKGIFYLLIALALLTVSAVALFSVVVSADDPEISAISSQGLSDYDMLDSSTSLRFMFKIKESNLSSYESVGFVFSKTVSTPEVDTAKCAVYTANKVYRSIRAGGESVEAGDGLLWVAVEVTNIPQSYFDGLLYIRAFVKDKVGGAIRYSDTKKVSVWWEHAQEWTWQSGKKDSKSTRVDFSEILSGGKHFYPDPSNGNQGNDLLIEYSLLWNNSLLNLPDTRLTSCLNSRSSPYRDLMWMSFANNSPNSDCQVSGGFEGCGGLSNRLYGPAGMMSSSSTYSNYPNVGGSDSANTEWGWHRVQIRFSQVLNNEAAVISGSAAQYTLTSTCYIDGTKVYALSYTGTGSSNSGRFGSNAQYALFQATQGDGKVDYTDNTGNFVYALFVSSAANATGTARFVYSDLSVTCGRDFVQSVMKNPSPASRTYKHSDGTEITAKVYYTACASSDPIVYASDMSSANREALPYTTSSQVMVKKDVNDVKGDRHYYEAGNDLLVECSFLWNETLANRGGVFCFQVTDSQTDLITIAMKDSAGANYAAKAGGIAARERNSYSYDYTDESLVSGSPSYVPIGGYGWHRLGFRVHQEARKDGASVAYTYTVTVYLDGERILQVDWSTWAKNTPKARLFDASIVDGNLVYSDVSDGKNNAYLAHESFFGAGTASYLVIGDLYMSCGSDFVMDVEPAESPVATTVFLGDTEVPSTVYFQLK